MSKKRRKITHRLASLRNKRDPRKRTRQSFNLEKLENRQLKTTTVFADEPSFIEEVGTVAGPIDPPIGEFGHVVAMEELAVFPGPNVEELEVVDFPENHLPSEIAVTGESNSNLDVQLAHPTNALGFTVTSASGSDAAGESQFHVQLLRDGELVDSTEFTTPAQGSQFVGIQSSETFDALMILEQEGGPQSDNPFSPNADAEFFGGFVIGSESPSTSLDQETVWLISDTNVRVLREDGEPLLVVETDGRAEVLVDSVSGNFMIVDNHSAYVFNASGDRFAFVADQEGRPQVVQGEGGNFWVIGDNDVVYMDKSGKVLRHIKDTGGKAEVVQGKDGAWWVVTKNTVACFDKDGKQIGAVIRGLDEPEIIQGEDGKFWVVDKDNVIYIDGKGKVLRHIKDTGGKAKIVKGKDGAWWVVTKNTVACFDKDGKQIGAVI
ncbi:hypothetical protein ACFL2H_06580, partial [Planctomycetota bacterium]